MKSISRLTSPPLNYWGRAVNIIWIQSEIFENKSLCMDIIPRDVETWKINFKLNSLGKYLNTDMGLILARTLPNKMDWTQYYKTLPFKI